MVKKIINLQDNQILFISLSEFDLKIPHEIKSPHIKITHNSYNISLSKNLLTIPLSNTDHKVLKNNKDLILKIKNFPYIIIITYKKDIDSYLNHHSTTINKFVNRVQQKFKNMDFTSKKFKNKQYTKFLLYIEPTATP